jgi:hypothetical protein
MVNHNTNNEDVKMYIDSIQDIYDKKLLTGWILHLESTIKSLRLPDGRELTFTKYDRPDVKAVYQNIKSENVGIRVIIDDKNLIDDVTVELDNGEKIENVFSFAKWCVYYSGFKNDKKSLIVVDDFYDDPNLVRSFAMKKMPYASSGYHKGKRSEKFILQGTKEKFESIIGRSIFNWDYAGYANGVFQYCVETDPIVYHVDSQTFAAIVFLSPDAPLDTGTATYKSKKTGVRRLTDEDTGKQVYNDTFSNDKGELDFYDSSSYELVDRVANVYNRLIIFDAKCIHAATRYYGDSIDNSRLFHIFFFDVA